MTPLQYASQNGHLCIVEYLINQKADINEKGNGGFLKLFQVLFIGLL